MRTVLEARKQSVTMRVEEFAAVLERAWPTLADAPAVVAERVRG